MAILKQETDLFMLVQIETLDGDRVLSSEKKICRTMGAMLDNRAPDPREGGQWRVTVLVKDLEFEEGLRRQAE